MVAPGAVYMQVAAAQAFVPETQLLDHPPAGVVFRPDAGFDPVQPDHHEAVVDGHRQRGGGHSPAVHRFVDPVAHLRRAGRPPDDAPDGQLPDEASAVGDHPRQGQPLPGFAAHGARHCDVGAEPGPVQGRLRVGRFPGAQPGGVAYAGVAPRPGVPDPHGPQADRRIQQGGLSDRHRPAAHASHRIIIPCPHAWRHAVARSGKPLAITVCPAIATCRNRRARPSYRTKAPPGPRGTARAVPGGVVSQIVRHLPSRYPGRGWSPPWAWSTAWARIGPSTAIPSRTPPVEPGRLTTRTIPASPAIPRDNIAAGTPAAAPPALIASAMPGISRSSTRRVISGVRSPGVSPVPPVVTTTS